MEHGGFKLEPLGDEHLRVVWKCSPDSEDIRQHLLTLLESIAEEMSQDRYPLGIGLGETIVWQLGEFGEQRALGDLERMRERNEETLAEAAIKALAKIRAGDDAKTV